MMKYENKLKDLQKRIIKTVSKPMTVIGKKKKKSQWV